MEGSERGLRKIPKVLSQIAIEMGSDLGLLFSHMPLTVNSKILARVLLSRNFAYAKFCENKILAKW